MGPQWVATKTDRKNAIKLQKTFVFRFNTGFSEVMTYKDQKNFVMCVLYLEPTQEFPEGLVLTGGNDKVILVYKPGEPFASLTFQEHTNAGRRL